MAKTLFLAKEGDAPCWSTVYLAYKGKNLCAEVMGEKSKTFCVHACSYVKKFTFLVWCLLMLVKLSDKIRIFNTRFLIPFLFYNFPLLDHESINHDVHIK